MVPRVVDHDERRMELTRAAMALVRDEGLAALSVRGLAAASGWSPGAVRHYLPTHQSMVDAVVEGVRSGFEARLLAVAPQPDPLEHARALLRAALPLDDESRELSRVWFAFLGSRAHLADGAGLIAYDELAGLLQDMFAGFQRAERLRSTTPRGAAVTLQATLDGLTIHLLMERVDADEAIAALDRALDQLVDRP